MKNKRETIDVKELCNLVPKEYLGNINLLFNKNVAKTPNTADELIIYRLAQLKETKVQQHFHKETNALACELKIINKFNKLFFVQNDNGDGAAGNLTNNQRMALFSRKKAEGSKAGFPDSSLIFYSSKLNYRDTTYCEIKKIGAPSEIHITENQLKWFIELNEMGFDAYITNNPVFFRDVVLKKIKNYFI